MGDSTVHNDAWSTTIIVKNIHCASCVSYIQRILTSTFGERLNHVETNILSHKVVVLHDKFISAPEICLSLSDAAFEVYSATTLDHARVKVQDLGADEGGDGWLEAADAFWRPSHRASSSWLHFESNRRNDHLANCDACRKGNIPQHASEFSDEKLLRDDLSGVASSRSDHRDNDGEEKTSAMSVSQRPSLDATNGDPNPDNDRHEAILSIGGMTCASCTGAVNHGLSELSYVEDINVTLMTNSARVVFVGQQNLENIVHAVEDLGYDCTVERSNLIKPKDESTPSEVSQRSITLKIDGMFCKHCPPRIVDIVKSRFPKSVTIEQTPTLDDPLLKVTYSPNPRHLTIRDIIAAIESLNQSFRATIYAPPSIEQRSQAMQKQEQHRLLMRLALSFVIAIPTLLIGVVWMSLVPSSNHVRRFFEKSVWAGNVTRGTWALFILATPVFFLAADVFHIRAIKEIRALWRKGSKVTLPQRFYRFGSMNLLISAGTSVAYFASIAVLGIDAVADPSSMMQSSAYFDSVVFLTFFILLGRYLEAYSKAKTGNAVGMLSDLRPAEAVLVSPSVGRQFSEVESTSSEELEKGTYHGQDTTQRIDAKVLEIGDIVMVRHGSSPPADGVVVWGTTKFNESSLTGESRAVSKQADDVVFAGSINIGDRIIIRISDVSGTSMLDQIVAVVREGQTKRAPVERVVDLLTGYFVPVITALAIITFVIWTTLGYSGALKPEYLDSQQGGWSFWSLQFAIAVFVVACPCGIGLAAPTALFVGSSLAARHGILVRGGGEAFQEASNIDAVVFDKTGTLTEGGDLKVTDHEMLVKDDEANIAWSLIKSLEETSSHPLARALFDLASKHSSQQIETVAISEHPGHGLRGSFAVKDPLSAETVTYEAALGNEALMSSLTPRTGDLDFFTNSALATWKSQSKSVALLALRKIERPGDITTSWTLAAIFAISDPLRPSSIPTITALQDRGVPVYMLTGDNPTTASAVASTLSIPQDHVFAGVLPTQKADKIRWLQNNAPRRSSSSSWLSRLVPQKRSKNAPTTAENQKAIIAFIGDGINDAPALTTASVSISFSSASDIAMHSSSFILLNSSLEKIITLFALSERVFRRVKFNFGWAVVYNVLLVPVAAGCLFRVREGGWRLGPVWGSAAMALSSLCVVVSSLALRWEGGLGVGRLGRAMRRG